MALFTPLVFKLAFSILALHIIQTPSTFTDTLAFLFCANDAVLIKITVIIISFFMILFFCFFVFARAPNSYREVMLSRNDDLIIIFCYSCLGRNLFNSKS